MATTGASAVLRKLNPISPEKVAARKQGLSDKFQKATVVDMTPPDDLLESLGNEYNGMVDSSLQTLQNGLELISKKFPGSSNVGDKVGLFRLTSERIGDLMASVARTAHDANATKELVAVLSGNMLAAKTLSSAIAGLRKAAANPDITELLDKLIEFAKLFNPDLWSLFNRATESIFENTGFAIGRFTRDLHLRWVELFKVQSIRCIMETVSCVVRTVSGYKSVRDMLEKERKQIEAIIAENPALEKVWNEGRDLQVQYEHDVARVEELKSQLVKSRDDMFNSETVSESSIKEAVEYANAKFQRLREVQIRYHTAVESALANMVMAEQAKLPLYALTLHLRSVVSFVIYSMMFIKTIAEFFAVKQLLLVQDSVKAMEDAASISSQNKIAIESLRLDQAPAATAAANTTS